MAVAQRWHGRGRAGGLLALPVEWQWPDGCWNCDGAEGERSSFTILPRCGD